MRHFLAIAFSMVAVGHCLADVSVTGTAHVPYVPDRAVFTINVIGDGETVKIAVEKCDAATKSLRQAIDSAGPDLVVIKSSQRVGPRYGYAGALVGTRAVTLLVVTVKDLKNLPAIVDVISVRREGVKVQLELDASQAEKIMDQARKAALMDAKRKAELYAQSAGASLGTVTSITEVSASITGPPVERYSRSESGIEFSQQSAFVELRVVFSLKTIAK